MISEDNSVAGYVPTGVVCTSDVATSLNNKTATGTGTIQITPALAENIDCTITNDDVAVDLPTITVVKTVSNLWGGGLTPPDFQLKIDGVDAAQGTPTRRVGRCPHDQRDRSSRLRADRRHLRRPGHQRDPWVRLAASTWLPGKT